MCLFCRHTEDMIVTPFAQVSPLKSFPVSLFYLLCYLKIWQMDKLRKKKKQPPDGMRLGFTGTSPQDHVGPATGSASRWCCLALAWDVRHSCAHFTQWKELRIQYCWIMLFKICMVADKAHAWIKSGHLILCGLSPHAESVFGDRCSGRRDLEECQWCYENIRKGVGDAFG